MKPASASLPFQNQFVISLWGLDLAAVIKAASAPLHARRPSIPRILLLQRDKPRGDPDAGRAAGKGGGGGGGGGKNAIRGIDCVRPSFLSGRKRTNLGIIEVRHERRAPPGRWDSGGSGGGSGAGGGGDEGADELQNEANVSEAGGEAGGRSGGGRKARSKRSGAACRKRRRQCKKARQLKAAAVAAAASSPPAVGPPGETAVGGTTGQADEGTTADPVAAAAVMEG